jgi:glycosyltransferase involved in cell wall biosynthesis
MTNKTQSAPRESAPRVSVIMPMYNGLPFVKEAIGSILDQSFQDFELLIVDNGSTDGSLQYAMSLSDPRVQVLSEREHGAGRALTAGIFAGRGEFLAVMDADDIAHPDRLRIEVEFLQAHPKIVLVGTRFAFIVGSDIVPVPPQPREHHDIQRALLQSRPVICNPSTMFRATEAKAVGGHRLPGPGHDVDFFLRMAEVGEVYNLPNVLHYYRLHGGSTSIVKMGEVNSYIGFSVACAKARAKGREEPDCDTFKLHWQHRSVISRLAEFADCKSLELYRWSVVKRAKKQFATGVAAGICAALLSPRRTSWHLKRKLGLC